MGGGYHCYLRQVSVLLGCSCVLILLTLPARVQPTTTASCVSCRDYFQRLENKTGASCRCLYRHVYSTDHPQLIADCHNLKDVPRFSAICNMSDVYSINLQHNGISEIGARAFSSLDMSDEVMSWAGVKPDLILLHNDIYYIHKDAFRGPLEGKLSYLDMKNNKLKSIPMAVYTLVNLTKLYLRDNEIESAEGDSKMRQLRELDLTSNKLSTFPADVCRFPALYRLYLDGNPIQGDMSTYLEEIARCKKLTVFTWPHEKLTCNQTQLETYANTSVCKEMIIRTSRNLKVTCDSSSSPKYRGVSLELALLRELSKICPGISRAGGLQPSLLWALVMPFLVVFVSNIPRLISDS